MFEEKVIEVLSIGDDLRKYGINNWALSKAQALLALEKLSAINKGLLGLDVMDMKGDKYEYSHENWSCELSEYGNLADFRKDSLLRAKRYILQFEDDEVYFSFVPE